jgi:uncharacterized protein YdaU (DUF1376 family)
MAKGDYYFKLHYQKLITATQGWKDDEFGAYLRLLIYQFDKGFIPKESSARARIITTEKKNWSMLSEKFPEHADGLLKNSFMDEVRNNRKKIDEKKRDNGKKGGRPKSKSVTDLITETKPNGFFLETNTIMVNGYLLEIINLLKEKEETIADENQSFFLMLILKMIDVFLKHNPEYFFHKETDYSACLQIAYNIAQMKKWSRHDVVNGKTGECVKAWETIVEFIKKDNWYSSRSLSDIATVKEWQRLVQTMKKERNGSHQQPSTKSAGANQLTGLLRNDIEDVAGRK